MLCFKTESELAIALESCQNANSELSGEDAANILQMMDDFVNENWATLGKQFGQCCKLTTDECLSLMRYKAEDMIFTNF
jgi:hypothetical protein